MSDDLYSKVDFTKKVRFQTDDEKNKNISGKMDNVVICDNYCTEECTQPKIPGNTSEDQQQAVSVSQSSRKRNLGVVSVFLVPLCLLFLAAVIVLLVLWIQDKSKWNTERTQLWVDNEKVISEKRILQTNYDEMKNVSANLTRKTSQLTEENMSLKAVNINLTNEIHKLQRQIEPRCSANWTRIHKYCYFFSTSKKNWTESSAFCQNLGGYLMIISSTEEQIIASSFWRHFWIGLSDLEKKGTWKWVSGQQVNKTYWQRNQPDNYTPGEDCVEIGDGNSDSNWNDLPCNTNYPFICEITN